MKQNNTKYNKIGEDKYNYQNYRIRANWWLV